MSALLAKTLRSTTFKLALVCIAIFGAVVVALLAYVYCAAASYVRGEVDHAITAEFAVLRNASKSGRAAVTGAITQRLADGHVEGSVYLFADPSFVPLAGNLPSWPPALKGSWGWREFSARQSPQLLRARFETLADGSHLLVGKDAGGLAEFSRRIETALLLCIALIFMLAAVASVAVTRRTVGRIEAINATSRAIMRSGLGQRIPLRGTGDEWDELAANLNGMLDRIEALMSEVKQVTDNVAHDLRTPLARMRGRLEKACEMQRNGGHDPSVAGDLMAELDNVLRMFSSLMRISQLEAYDQRPPFRSVDLVEIAAEVVELFDAAAEERGVSLGVAGDRRVPVKGDRNLLFDALANLVDNAIKHGRKDGHVTVSVTEAAGSAILSVADDGPGIPPGEYEQVFKRFYRLEQSRCTPGNGLGLSLVSAVARIHGARIGLAAKAPGLNAELRFPLA